AAHLGFPVRGRHRALGDAEATWAVLRRFLEMLSGSGVKTLGGLFETGGGAPPAAPAGPLAAPPASVLEEVAAALEAGRALRLIYLSSDGRTTERTVDPLGLFEAGEHTYVEAFCRLRRDRRHFRLDRIQGIRPA
ncbi:MAG: WYL domain-containing protein, partial [Nitrospinota bacterium]